MQTRVAATAALAALLAASCSQPTGTQPYPGACDPFVPLYWDPAPNAQGVPRDTSIRVLLSDYPEPDTLGTSGMILSSGVFWHTGTYAVDLIDRAVIFRPSNPLRANLGYTVSVSSELRSLRGCALEAQSRGFQTGDGVADIPPADVTFSGVQPILARSCAGAACHRQPEEAGGGCLAEPAEGLSLCDEQARDALVGVPSRQVGRLQLVAPRDPARSYLLRKLLPGSSPDVPVPTTLGHRDPPGSPLSPAELRALSDWIEGGARG